jgi:hypothetical protein
MTAAINNPDSSAAAVTAAAASTDTVMVSCKAASFAVLLLLIGADCSTVQMPYHIQHASRIEHKLTLNEQHHYGLLRSMVV